MNGKLVKLPGMPPMTQADYRLFRQCMNIKGAYADGVPLTADDRKAVLTALRKHPKGREKFGAGVQAVIVNTYVFGGRCFFVIRADGTAEDFSLYKCFGRSLDDKRTTRLIGAMANFDYAGLVQRFRMFRASRRVTRPEVKTP